MRERSDQPNAVSSSPDIMGGTPVFTGTRVPVETLMDYLAGGESVDDFLEGFPTVSREQVGRLLDETNASLPGQPKEENP